jgi:hypothetical protein
VAIPFFMFIGVELPLLFKAFFITTMIFMVLWITMIDEAK